MSILNRGAITNALVTLGNTEGKKKRKVFCRSHIFLNGNLPLH